ncbi:MAG: hypothetical protein E7343_02490 [Clostridiales bacterium]|nr:hypothetical protein [Clostridiales bacterium]
MSEKKSQTEEFNSGQDKKKYCDTLNEETATTDSSTCESVELKGSNGFSDGERKFGFVLCWIVMALIFIINATSVLSIIFRPRELTMENYQDYITVDVVNCGTNTGTNEAEYEIRVSRKEKTYDVTNFSMKVEVTFELLPANLPYMQGYDEEITYQMSFSDFLLKENETLVHKLTLPHVLYSENTVTVITVSGGM